jgi:hypothetical protein
MTTEYLLEKKTYYEDKCNYFKNLEFNTLATDFQGVVDLIGEMENYIKEKEKGI